MSSSPSDSIRRSIFLVYGANLSDRTGRRGLDRAALDQKVELLAFIFGMRFKI
jgi:hypothetical protein